MRPRFSSLPEPLRTYRRVVSHTYGLRVGPDGERTLLRLLARKQICLGRDAPRPRTPTHQRGYALRACAASLELRPSEEPEVGGGRVGRYTVCQQAGNRGPIRKQESGRRHTYFFTCALMCNGDDYDEALDTIHLHCASCDFVCTCIQTR